MISSWFLLALVGVVLYSVTQIIDKVSVDKLFDTISGWLCAAGLLSCLPLGIMLMKGGDLTISPEFALLSIACGLIQYVSYYFYGKAIVEEGADIISALWQMLPIYAVVAGFLFLGETLSPLNALGVFVVASIAFYLSFPHTKEGILKSLKSIATKPVFMYMQIACAVTIISTMWVDYMVETTSSDAVFVWNYVGYMIYGFGALFFIKNKKQNMLKLMSDPRKFAFMILAVSAVEILDGVAEYAVMNAYAVASYGIVTAVSALQPLCIISIVAFANMIKQGALNDLVDNSRTLSTKLPAFAGMFMGVYIMLV